MKKIYKSCLLMAFALVTNSAFSQITFDFSRARTSGSSVVQTISNNGFNYVLTATHNSGDVDLWGDDSGEFTSSGNSLFFSPNATSTPEIWTVSLTRDGVPYAFDLENVSYERFCGSSPTFDLVNDENITMATANSIALGAGSFIITGNNTGISNFTITSNTGGATLCTDFGNIIVTPVEVPLGQITFDFSTAIMSERSSITQTISNNAFTYVLTATHNSGSAQIFGDDSFEMTPSGYSRLFFADTVLTQPEIWTISLTRDGLPYSFDLNNVSYQTVSDNTTDSFIVANDQNFTIATANDLTIGPGSFSIIENNINITNFTISSNDVFATQNTDFGNIKLTPVDVVLSTNENEVTVRTVSNVSPNPTTGIVKLSFDNDVEKQIELFDANGQLLTSQTSINKEEIINLNDYNSGLYYVRVTNKQANQTIRVVKL